MNDPFTKQELIKQNINIRAKLVGCIKQNGGSKFASFRAKVKM